MVESGTAAPVITVAVVGAGLALTSGIEPVRADADWSYWRPRMRSIYDAVPSPAHRALGALSRRGELSVVITDSDDLLLEEVGVDALELNPTAEQSFCAACGYSEPIGCLLDMAPTPCCAACGAVLTPGPLTAVDPDRLKMAEQVLRQADAVLVVDAVADELLRLVDETAPDGTVEHIGAQELVRLAARPWPRPGL